MTRLKGLTLRELEIFMTIVETGSMAGAAKRLETSPSAISQQVVNLERAMGVALFDRTLRPIGLTPAGAVLRGHALKILDSVDEAWSALTDAKLTGLGELRIGVIDSFDVPIAPRLVASLSEEFPATRISVWSGRSEEHRRALENREADMILTGDAMEDVDRLERYPLLREKMIVVAAKGVLPRRGDIAGRLKQLPLVRYSARMPLGRDIERHLRRLRIVPERHHEFYSSASVYGLAVETGGWAITTPVCLLSCEPGFSDKLDIYRFPYASLGRTVSLVAREGELGSLPARMAVLSSDILRAETLPRFRRLVSWADEALELAEPPIIGGAN